MKWCKLPVRKPLAVGAAMWGAGLVSLAFLLNRDIPPGCVSITQAIIVACVGGYCASSGWEAVKGNGSDSGKDIDVLTDAIGFQVLEDEK